MDRVALKRRKLAKAFAKSVKLSVEDCTRALELAGDDPDRAAVTLLEWSASGVPPPCQASGGLATPQEQQAAPSIAMSRGAPGGPGTVAAAPQAGSAPLSPGEACVPSLGGSNGLPASGLPAAAALNSSSSTPSSGGHHSSPAGQAARTATGTLQLLRSLASSGPTQLASADACAAALHDWPSESIVVEAANKGAGAAQAEGLQSDTLSSAEGTSLLATLADACSAATPHVATLSRVLFGTQAEWEAADASCAGAALRTGLAAATVVAHLCRVLRVPAGVRTDEAPAAAAALVVAVLRCLSLPAARGRAQLPPERDASKTGGPTTAQASLQPEAKARVADALPRAGRFAARLAAAVRSLARSVSGSLVPLDAGEALAAACCEVVGSSPAGLGRGRSREPGVASALALHETLQHAAIEGPAAVFRRWPEAQRGVVDDALSAARAASQGPARGRSRHACMASCVVATAHVAGHGRARASAEEAATASLSAVRLGSAPLATAPSLLLFRLVAEAAVEALGRPAPCRTLGGVSGSSQAASASLRAASTAAAATASSIATVLVTRAAAKPLARSKRARDAATGGAAEAAAAAAAAPEWRRAIEVLATDAAGAAGNPMGLGSALLLEALAACAVKAAGGTSGPSDAGARQSVVALPAVASAIGFAADVAAVRKAQGGALSGGAAQLRGWSKSAGLGRARAALHSAQRGETEGAGDASGTSAATGASAAPDRPHSPLLAAVDLVEAAAVAAVQQRRHTPSLAGPAPTLAPFLQSPPRRELFGERLPAGREEGVLNVRRQL